MLTTQPKKKRAANRKKHLQIKKTTFVNLTTHKLQMLTTQPKKKRAANKMYLVVLWAFAVFLYLFVLWAFAPSAVKMMKIYS